MKRLTTTLLLLIAATINVCAQQPVKDLPIFNKILEQEPISYKNRIPNYISDEIGNPYSANHRNKSAAKATNNEIYAIRGEQYAMVDKSLAGLLEYFYDADGNIIRETFSGVHENYYDSCVYIYYSTSMDNDYIAFRKNSIGNYEPAVKYLDIYSYPQNSGNDSIYWREENYRWSKTDNRWKKESKYQFDHFSPEYYSRYKFSWFTPNSDSTEWIQRLEEYNIDSILYNDDGNINQIYFADHSSSGIFYSMHEYVYNDDGSYNEVIVSRIQYGAWAISYKYTNIQWEKYYGFTILPYLNMEIGGFEVSPFSPHKINRPTSWNICNYNSGQWRVVDSYKVNWDVNEISHAYTSFHVVDGVVTRYPHGVNIYQHNEHNDMVKCTSSRFTMPDYYGNVTETRYTTRLCERTYEEGFGESGCMEYWINYDTNLNPDTTFISGYQITEFSNTPNIFLPIEDFKSVADTRLSIYPNPAQNTITLSSDEEMERISIYTSAGRLVQESSPLSTIVQLRISELSKGVYIIKAHFKDGSMKVEKLVVE